MAAQTWDLAYYTTLVPATGVGNTDSAGGDNVTVHNDWPITYVSSVVSATGTGNTDSTGAGTAGTPTLWPFNYWDGVNYSTGVGNTYSGGAGAGDALNATWYDITGTVSAFAPADGAGNTLSQGDDLGAAPPGYASGVGNTSSTGDNLTVIAVNLPPSPPPGAVDNPVPVAEVLADRVLIGVSE